MAARVLAPLASIIRAYYAPVKGLVTQDDQDRQLVRDALATVSDLASKRAKARALGVSEGLVRVWLDSKKEIGVPLSDKVRSALRNALRSGAKAGWRAEEEMPGEALWRMEMEAARDRARALHELATAERIHAEASRLRAEALAHQSRAAETDSARAKEAGAPDRLLYEVKDLTGRDAALIIAALLDRAREQGIAAGGATVTPGELAG